MVVTFEPQEERFNNREVLWRTRLDLNRVPDLIFEYESILGDVRRWVGLRSEHLFSS